MNRNVNCLEIKNPFLAAQWHPTKNGNLTPYDVAANSHKKAWWVCEKGHEWNAQISNRNNGNGCLYCSHKIAFDDWNLLKCYPELCKEWNYDKNIKLPSEYTPKNNQKVWWKCSKCDHEWESTINKRTVLERGCPKCNESKGEKRIREWLVKNNITFETEFKFVDLLGIRGGLLRFDFCIYNNVNKTDIMCLIEYDGGQHFKLVKEWQSKYDFNRTKQHDILKNNYCKDNNIKLLRIPYIDFNNIESILSNQIILY